MCWFTEVIALFIILSYDCLVQFIETKYRSYFVHIDLYYYKNKADTVDIKIKCLWTFEHVQVWCFIGEVGVTLNIRTNGNTISKGDVMTVLNKGPGTFVI